MGRWGDGEMGRWGDGRPACTQVDGLAVGHATGTIGRWPRYGIDRWSRYGNGNLS
ncbi:hypothetical protein [Moorena sp. SIO3I6]|uniref:hypothetical protein n=1 Tax=Moorena sp. SIO3I6 TaxID=2607831 RepID=UPI0013FB9909|nr:hypothetical protein [Moorena sp. SIO3I6]NEP26177.1 hypothetical protein [Moorena sp. SIO3I6]NEQ63570.1 hypothetical protein [Moorena sp. SIO4A1]